MSQYFLTKSGKIVDPRTPDDLRSYLAYGSVRDCDLTMGAGEQVWMPLRQLEELQLDQGTESLQEITRRRRVVRYREYEKVPLKQQSGWVIQELMLWFVTSNAMSIVRELVGLLKTGIADLQTSMGQ